MRAQSRAPAANLDARVRFGRPFRHGRAHVRVRTASRRHAGGGVHGPARRRGRGPAPARDPGPSEVLLEVSHCGICGSDLHFLLEWGGRDGRDRGPRVQRHGRRGRRRRSTGWHVGRPGRRRAVAASAARASTASRTGRRCASSAAGSAPTRATGRARSPGTRPLPAAELLRVPDGLSLEARRARRAAGGRAARHHAGRRCPARHALARHRRRPDRVPVGRGAARRSASTTSS